MFLFLQVATGKGLPGVPEEALNCWTMLGLLKTMGIFEVVVNEFCIMKLVISLWEQGASCCGFNTKCPYRSLWPDTWSPAGGDIHEGYETCRWRKWATGGGLWDFRDWSHWLLCLCFLCPGTVGSSSFLLMPPLIYTMSSLPWRFLTLWENIISLELSGYLS